ncbi:uncharacterized protein LOC135834569 [Planococcus citri]|uniref:uncharacterized protein LOC135834569 n=1 Tax=Planococcus citri TaxID=170843 RepID=UPI0031F9F933
MQKTKFGSSTLHILLILLCTLNNLISVNGQDELDILEFSTELSEPASTLAPETLYCQYFRKYDGSVCPNREFLSKRNNFNYTENGDLIYEYENKSRSIFKSGTFANESSFKQGIFHCGQSSPIFDIRRTNYEVILSSISIMFLVIYLINNGLKSFQNKVLYSYSIMLIMLYLSFIGKILTTICILAQIRKVLRLFYCVWAALMSIEFWRVTYYTLRSRRLSTKGQNKRFLIYCFFGYVLPLIYAVVFFFSKFNKMLNCPSVTGYSILPCPAITAGRVYKVLQKVRFAGFTILALVLFLQACVLIYFAKFYRIQSTMNRKYLVVLIKIAYMMGIYWMIFVYFILFIPRSFFLYNFMRTAIDTVFLYPHGVFMYFAFGFENTRLKSMLTAGKSIFFVLKYRSRSNQKTQVTKVDSGSVNGVIGTSQTSSL